MTPTRIALAAIVLTAASCVAAMADEPPVPPTRPLEWATAAGTPPAAAERPAQPSAPVDATHGAARGITKNVKPTAPEAAAPSPLPPPPCCVVRLSPDELNLLGTLLGQVPDAQRALLESLRGQYRAQVGPKP